MEGEVLGLDEELGSSLKVVVRMRRKTRPACSGCMVVFVV